MSEPAPTLDSLGAGIQPPGSDAEGHAEKTLADAEVSEARHGRLARLARWWVTTAGTGAGPASVVQLWGTPASGAGDGAIRVLPPAVPETVDAAIAWGAAAVDDVVDGGADLLLCCAPARIAAKVLAAHLVDMDAIEALGWPGQSGLDDQVWSAEVVAVRDGLRRTAGVRGDPAGLLHALGSPTMAAACAALLQAAARRTPVILDGLGAAAAGLLARRVERPVQAWWQVGSVADGDALTGRVLTGLALKPLLQLDLRIEDGTGARLALAVLHEATALLSGLGRAADG